MRQKNSIQNSFCFLAMVILISSCESHVTSNNNDTAPTLPKTWHDEESIMAILYQQQAAEYRALCYQAYNIAAMRVTDAVKNNKHKDSLAVITDLDETAIDNSDFEVREYNH